MNIFNWFRKRPEVDEKDMARLYALPTPEPIAEQPLSSHRFVVVDLEATGLNTLKDNVLSIGAVAIENNSLVMGELFSRTLKRDVNTISESVLIHQIAPSETAAGERTETALLDFLEYVNGSPLVAYSADFDQRLLTREFKEIFSFSFKYPFFDVAEIAPMLFPEHGMRCPTMDDWIEFFGLEILQRHNACADAMVTAELMLILLNKAQVLGINTLKDLEVSLNNYRRRQSRTMSI